MNIELPKALSRARSRDGVVSLWKAMAREIYCPEVLADLPAFAEKLAKVFWDVTASDIIHAITIGDCAFFVAFQIRLEQIENASIECGKPYESRVAITRAKYLVDGFRQAAETYLDRYGGKWPPMEISEPA